MLIAAVSSRLRWGGGRTNHLHSEERKRKEHVEK